MLLALSACSGMGSSATNGPAMVPSMNAANPINAATVEPLTKQVTVTASLGRKRLANVLVTLWKSSLPDCPLCEPKRNHKLAEGITDSNGQIVLSGPWTHKTYVCAVGTANGTKRHKLVQLCAKPLPKKVTLQFN